MNALGLLLLGAALHYGWALFPEHAALVWNIAGSVARLLMLSVVVYLIYALLRSKGKRMGRAMFQWSASVVLWYVAEELLVIGCNAAFIVRPWFVPKGKAMCSSLLQYDLGTVGLLLVAILAWRLAVLRSRDKM